MMRYLMIFLMLIVHSISLQAQQFALQHVEPPSWWVGMHHKQLQLMVYGEDIAQTHPEIKYRGVKLVKVHKAESPNYLFLDLEITPDAASGKFPIVFKKGKKEVARYVYTLKDKIRHQEQEGINAQDVIYLITPDRFRNGDTANDQVKEMQEGVDRNNPDGRHGGDLAGIIAALPYFQELGVTTLWLNPVLENNMKEVSYHGYSTTDYYEVDPRYGSNALYKKLADELHKRDMKLVMDMIFNHCGLEHWWMKDLPFQDWVHDFPGYEITNHAIVAVSDPHAAKADLKSLQQGWFVPSMPDLNHENPFMAHYLIQNSIWWIAYAGLDGIRMDTYPYNDKEMMVKWAERVHAEYPGFYLLGETWVGDPATEAFWSAQNPEDLQAYDSKLSSVTDFPLCYGVREAFKADGEAKALYEVISKDFLYDKPATNTIFPGNHDMDRLFYAIGEDIDRFKNAMTFLFTTRGIPQFYYGEEILMKNHGPHGLLREDFPGGWKEDPRNAFTKEGRTDMENESFDYLKKLLRWRKTSKAIAQGSLKHFVPYNNVYVYNRKAGEASILVIINNKEKEESLEMGRYAEVLKGYTTATNVLTGEVLSDLGQIHLAGNSSLILKLQKKNE